MGKPPDKFNPFARQLAGLRIQGDGSITGNVVRAEAVDPPQAEHWGKRLIKDLTSGERLPLTAKEADSFLRSIASPQELQGQDRYNLDQISERLYKFGLRKDDREVRQEAKKTGYQYLKQEADNRLTDDNRSLWFEDETVVRAMAGALDKHFYKGKWIAAGHGNYDVFVWLNDLAKIADKQQALRREGRDSMALFNREKSDRFIDDVNNFWTVELSSPERFKERFFPDVPAKELERLYALSQELLAKSGSEIKQRVAPGYLMKNCLVAAASIEYREKQQAQGKDAVPLDDLFSMSVNARQFAQDQRELLAGRSIAQTVADIKRDNPDKFEPEKDFLDECYLYGLDEKGLVTFNLKNGKFNSPSYGNRRLLWHCIPEHQYWYGMAVEYMKSLQKNETPT